MTESKEQEPSPGAENNIIETHKFDYWFGIPVAVQLAQPYLVPTDAGPQKVPFASGTTRTMGTPIVVPKEKGNAALAVLSGTLHPDGPERVVLLCNIEGLGLIRVGLVVGMITHITAIDEPQQDSRIVTPR